MTNTTSETKRTRELFQNMDHTYASRKNVLAAIEKKGHSHLLEEHRWLIATNEAGRMYIVFVGQSAVEEQLFHAGYCVTS
jgi:hypothetical protein